MAPANSNNPPWATTELTSTLAAHVVFQRHNMAVPPYILPDDVERAIRILDQHDPSTAKAGAEHLEPIQYNQAKYRVNEDLRPMAKAADMANLHQAGILKKNLADRLTEWDALHIPLMAALLPRKDKATRPAIPRQVVSTQQKAKTEPAESKKRKAVPTQATASKKPRNNANAAPEDHDVETEDRTEPNDGGFRLQPAIEGSTSTRTLAQARTRLRKPRNGQPIATETHLEPNKSKAGLAGGEIGEDEGSVRNDALTQNREEDDKMLETEVGEVQVAGLERRRTKRQVTRRGKGKKKNTKAGTAKEVLNKDGTLKTVKQLEEEQRLKDEEEEKKLHEARSLGHYLDPILAKQFRVVNKTVRAPLDGHIRPGVKPAPTDQLGSWRLHERLMNQAKEEGKGLDLWMGGGASPSRNGSEEDIYEEW